MNRVKTFLEKAAKTIPMILALLLLLSVATPIASASGWRAAPASNPFTDVRPGQWHHDYVSWAWINGITTGTSPTTFRPNNNVTRGQFATFLWRIAGRPQVSPAHSFTDVPSGQFFSTPVAWAHRNNIVEGINPTTFGTDRAITREQLAAMLFRYIRHIGGDTSSSADALNRFTDRGSVSGWATEYMRWAAHQGILGVGTNEINPRGNAHRSHTVATLHRVVNMFSIGAQNLPPLPQIPIATRPISFFVNNPQEVIVTAARDMTVETDYYVFHIKAGQIYSNLFFYLVDDVISFVHERMGWHMPNSGQKVDIYFDAIHPFGGLTAPWAYGNPQTGELKMSIQNWTQQSYKANGGVAFIGWDLSDFVAEIAHEYAHALSWAFTRPAVGRHSVIHEEGNATFIHNAAIIHFFGGDGRTIKLYDSNGNLFSSRSGGLALFDHADSFRNIVHDRGRLSNILNTHGYPSGVDAYNFGGLFYKYLYENHGSQYVREILTVMNGTRPSNAVSIINNILGVNILETYPTWFDANRN